MGPDVFCLISEMLFSIFLSEILINKKLEKSNKKLRKSEKTKDEHANSFL